MICNCSVCNEVKHNAAGDYWSPLCIDCSKANWKLVGPYYGHNYNWEVIVVPNENESGGVIYAEERY